MAWQCNLLFLSEFCTNLRMLLRPEFSKHLWFYAFSIGRRYFIKTCQVLLEKNWWSQNSLRLEKQLTWLNMIHTLKEFWTSHNVSQILEKTDGLSKIVCHILIHILKIILSDKLPNSSKMQSSSATLPTFFFVYYAEHLLLYLALWKDFHQYLLMRVGQRPYKVNEKRGDCQKSWLLLSSSSSCLIGNAVVKIHGVESSTAVPTTRI